MKTLIYKLIKFLINGTALKDNKPYVLLPTNVL